MFLVAHVNFLALKLSRIKSAVGWGGGEGWWTEGKAGGDTGVFRLPPMWHGECGRQDYLASRRVEREAVSWVHEPRANEASLWTAASGGAARTVNRQFARVLKHLTLQGSRLPPERLAWMLQQRHFYQICHSSVATSQWVASRGVSSEPRSSQTTPRDRQKYI